ncbi:MAG: bacterial Ig-like domain-containing protein [Eubacteriales bacterium]|nr:bacterial Ig-like domain-containing protein [Eubacteriales bacterium]
MKKIVSILIAAVMVLGVASLGISAASITYAAGPNNSKITCVDFLDFSEANNKEWVEKDADGNWVAKSVSMTPSDPDTLVANSAYIPLKQKNLIKFMKDGSTGADHLTWTLTDNGEILKLKAVDSSKTPGIPFCLDDMGVDITAGQELKGRMEYCKIRIRNYSSADQVSLAFTSSNIGGGGRVISNVSITNVDVDAASPEWKTYTFSMIEQNSATNYGSSLQVDEKTGIAGSRWAGNIMDVVFFPFGYNITDGTGAHEGAEMDIDYIVFGTKEYCENYKSALENKESLVSKIEITKPATKTTYYVGEGLDTTGMEVTATFEDGSKEVLESYNVVYNFNEETDSSEVTVSYGSASQKYNVKVIGIKEIAIETPAKTTTYERASIGSVFAPEGLSIKVTYNDGTTAVKALGSFKLEHDALKVGDNVITINFFGAKTNFTINVINVVSIKIDALDKTYRYGGEISDKDISDKITCVYSDGSEKSYADAKINATFEKEYDLTKAGEIEVKVKLTASAYDIDCSATTTAKVEAPASVEADTSLAKLEYNVDDRFSTEGLIVSYVYADGKKVILKADDYTVKYDFSEPGEQKVTVTDKYAGLSASFMATVKGTAKPTTTKPATTAASSGGCKSVIGAGAAIAIVSVIGAGVVLGKKKEN